MDQPWCDIEIRVRYAETDRMGFVHHSRYFVYFEMGRTELLRRAGIAYRDLEDAGVFFVVAKLACRYLAPGRYDDVLVLTTTQKRMTTARIDHVYALRRKETGETLTEAETTLACVDGHGTIIAIPDFVRDARPGE
jgi:acyl-CoA thioester hydrolase